MILLALAVLAALVLLFLTWYHADNTPLFGPSQAGRVTFKQVLQGLMRDTADLLKLKACALWLQTNVVALAVLVSGMISVADPTLRTALLSSTYHGIPIGAVAMMVVTWLATVKPTVHTRNYGDPA